MAVTVDPDAVAAGHSNGSMAMRGAALTQALIDKVRELNDDDGVHGIIVQLPLPLEVDTKRVLAEIRYLAHQVERGY